MRVLLRADADSQRGTGHVMRCLSLGEALVQRGHTVSLMACISSVPWLEDRLADVAIAVIPCEPDSLDLDAIRGHEPDWVVVDSYWIPPDEITRVNSEIRCLAIVDGDDRGIVASLYLDHNLGAEKSIRPERAPGRTLAGSQFSLIRDEILQARRDDPEAIRHDPPHVVAFIGGTDPNALIVDVVAALSSSDLRLTLTAVCAASAIESVTEIARGNSNIEVISATNELPELLSRADSVISASGTSVWELCTLGIPSLVLATVDNQLGSLAAVRDAGVAHGLDVTSGLVGEVLVRATRMLLTDDEARHQLTARCRELFDGRGKNRVAEAMEMMLA